VDDLVDGLITMMSSSDEVVGPINLGNPGEFTIAELAAKVLSLTGSTVPVEYLPLPQDDPVRRQPDIARAIRELGWRPTIDLDEGLVRTVDYFKATLA
jgi:UDP-glucuronate decarboxylase